MPAEALIDAGILGCLAGGPGPGLAWGLSEPRPMDLREIVNGEDAGM